MVRRFAVVAVGAVGVSLMAAVGPTAVTVVASAASPTTVSTTAATSAGTLAASATVAALQRSAVTQRAAAVRPAARATSRATMAPYRFATRAYNQWWARVLMIRSYHWTAPVQYRALIRLWDRESHWNMRAHNYRSGAHGIPQALPGGKMRTAGTDWRTNPVTQIKWGLTYIHHRYGTPLRAWSHYLHHGWY
jgi:hypothetical protein